jgi:tRNA threonylcarbamoyladenosine biosynthesis protein TsaE
MKTTLVHGLAELKAFARELAATAGRRRLVLLDGPMGAGKTQLVREVVEVLGGAAVMSPTFAIHNRYETRLGPVDHVDLYRLESDAELENTGFWDLFARDEGLIFVEWAAKLPDGAWPRGWPVMRLNIEARADGSREITLS